MTAVQRLQLKQSELKSQISEELGKPEGDRDHATLESLTKQAANTEIELRAALTAESDSDLPPDKETPRAPDEKLLELREAVDFGDYVGAALTGRGVRDGAALELNQELGVDADQFPLAALVPAVEERAALDGDGQQNQQSWIDRLFAMSAAARVGVTMRSVGAGVSTVPLTTAGGSGAQRGRTQDTATSTFAFSLTEMKPTRNSCLLEYSQEDALRVPGLADSIRRDLRAAVMDSVDLAMFKGDSTASENSADLVGFEGASITERTLSQSNKVKGPETLSEFADMIDGVYASDFGDLNVVTAVGAWRLWEKTIINTAADNMTLAAFLKNAGLMWTSRGNIESNTANGDFAAFVGRKRGIQGAAVAAVWQNASLIIDRYSKAKSAEIQLSLHHFWDFKIPRTANFERVKFVT